MSSPAHAIVSELLKRGAVPEKELYESVKRELEGLGLEMSRRDFLKALMMLELRGYIKVEGARRVVQLIRTPSA